MIKSDKQNKIFCVFGRRIIFVKYFDRNGMSAKRMSFDLHASMRSTFRKFNE